MGTIIKAIFAFFVLVFGIVTAWPAAAQSYPSKPIRIIVPGAAGGLPDIAVRGHAKELGEQLGQQVVVDNRPGASGIIGFEMMANATPDGYTLGYATFLIATNPAMFSRLPYNSARDFQPIIIGGSNPNLLTVNQSLLIRSVKELTEHAKANPGKLSYGSSGIGSSMHLAMELFSMRTGTRLVHVSYKGIQQAITDVIGGQIEIACDNLGSILPHVKGGRVRALGVTSLKRSPVIPEIPTIDEAGLPDYEISPWAGYVAPVRVPREIVLRLNREFNKALASPAVLATVAARGSFPGGGTPEQFADLMRRETERWGKVIRTAGIKPQ
jgi:tripartite-type tricarboxylate transporter receptor subunit TctC